MSEESVVKLGMEPLKGHEYAHIMFDEPTSEQRREWRRFERELYVANVAIQDWRES